MCSSLSTSFGNYIQYIQHASLKRICIFTQIFPAKCLLLNELHMSTSIIHNQPKVKMTRKLYKYILLFVVLVVFVFTWRNSGVSTQQKEKNNGWMAKPKKELSRNGLGHKIIKYHYVWQAQNGLDFSVRSSSVTLNYLGFHSKQYIKETNDSIQPTVIIGGVINKFRKIKSTVASVQKQLPLIRIIVYDISLTSYQRNSVSSVSTFLYLKFLRRKRTVFSQYSIKYS